MIDDLKIDKSLQEKTPDHGDQLRSLSEVHSSISVPEGVGFWKKMAAFAGPGLMVAVGYIDPGNWATDIAGGPPTKTFTRNGLPARTAAA